VAPGATLTICDWNFIKMSNHRSEAKPPISSKMKSFRKTLLKNRIKLTDLNDGQPFIMKKSFIAFIITFIGLNFACAQRMHDSSGRQIGRVDAERYYDGSGHQIGRVDGTYIYDGSGRQLGRIDGDRVYNSSGRQIGRVDGERLYSASGSPMGRIDGERIYDASGRQIGRADGLRRMQMIVFFYFFM
jgi:hypothetical protein